MNDDLNNVDCSESYSYTPIFAYFKNGFKRYPIAYRNNTCDSDSLLNFFEVSL